MSIERGEIAPFDEGNAKPVIWSFVSLSFGTGTDTRAYDAYRQGIELTMPRYFFQGIVKIHSGEDNHEVKQNHFGQARIRNTPLPRYEEIDNWDPVSFVKFDHDISPITLLRVYRNTFPIIIGDIDRYEFLNGDGALEPFTIRGKAANYSIEIPFFVHDIKASFEEGNQNYLFAGDRVVNVYTPKDEKAETNYFDSVDTTDGGGTVVGYVSPEIAHLSPHEDNKQRTGIKLTANMDTTMVSALNSMSPPEDGYVTSNQIVMAAGFVYDFGRCGTDSVAFGGLSASPIQSAQEIEV